MVNNIIEKINSYSWADWSLNKMEIDYEKVVISIRSNRDSTVNIYCLNHIGFCFMGHWDESIIEGISVDNEGGLIDKSLEAIRNLYGDNPLPGGGVKKIYDNWYQVNIKLIDGLFIRIACKELEINGI